MKILFVHNAYRQRGGEDAVVDAEQSLLRAHGHTVHLYQRHNDELREQSVLGSMAAAAGSLWNLRSAREIRQMCERLEPDVIHAHNTFPLISPAFFWMAGQRGIPVIQTLHNFRLLCPEAMLLREGRVCQDCVGKFPWRAVTRACYRDSVAQSAVVTAMLGTHRALSTYQTQVTQYIVFNHFCRDKFIAGGLPAERLQIKPHFVKAPPLAETGGRSGGIFLGRLAPEKGLDLLAQALQGCPGTQVRIIGDGPELASVQKNFGRLHLGARPHQEVMQLLQGAAFLVAPSISFESFGMNLVEAFASATPVIASRHGAYAELVADGETGLLFSPGDARDLPTRSTGPPVIRPRCGAWGKPPGASMKRTTRRSAIIN